MDPIKAHNKEILNHLESRIRELHRDYNGFNNAYNDIRTNSLGHLLKAGVNIMFELFFYSLSIISVVLGITGLIFSEAFLNEILQNGDPSIANMEEFGVIVVICCVLIFCCTGFLFMVGLLFTKIRKKNKTLKKLSFLIENALKATRSSLERAKNSRTDVMTLIMEAERMERKPPPPSSPFEM